MRDGPLRADETRWWRAKRRILIITIHIPFSLVMAGLCIRELGHLTAREEGVFPMIIVLSALGMAVLFLLGSLHSVCFRIGFEGDNLCWYSFPTGLQRTRLVDIKHVHLSQEHNRNGTFARATIICHGGRKVLVREWGLRGYAEFLSALDERMRLAQEASCTKVSS